MEDSFNKADELGKNIREYINNRISLLKIEIAERVSNLLSRFISTIIVSIIFLITLFFISTAIALIIGQTLGNYCWGFLIVGIFYFIAGLIFWKRKDKIIRIPIMNEILRQLFKEEV